MIASFEGPTADYAWRAAVSAILNRGMPQSGRGGPTRELLHVGLQIADPRQRWIHSRREALNIAFAIADVIWILGGRDDAAFLNYFNRSLPKFAGDGTTYYGAYGERLRSRFDLDQLRQAAEALSANPTSRQVVLSIWDPRTDLPAADGMPRAPDIPCNIVSMLKARDGRLDWTQVMRSNDAYRGLPHNLIQFTFLQEIMAGWAGLRPGLYTHWSDSLHLYERDLATNPIRDVAETMPVSSDDFALPWTSFEKSWPSIESFAERVTNEGVLADEIVSTLNGLEVPQAWHNALRILAAEGLRRRRADPAPALRGLTCNVLTFLWDRWLARLAGSRQAT